MKFPQDIASYINRRGGKQVVFGRIKMNSVLNHYKVILFIQKIRSAGQIDPKSDLANLIRKVTEPVLKNLNSLENAVNMITSKKLQAVTAIYNTSWEELGLKQPVLSLEERQKIMGITIEEMQEIAKASMKLQELEKARGKVEVQEDFFDWQSCDIFSMVGKEEFEKSI